MADKDKTNIERKPQGRKMTVESLAKIRGPLLAGCTTQECCN
jgi:hypothetical protein